MHFLAALVPVLSVLSLVSASPIADPPAEDGFLTADNATLFDERATETLGQKILAQAEKAKGIKYVFGGGSCSGPTGGGFDCSGLVSWAVCKVTGRNLFKQDLRVTNDMYCASAKKLAPYTKVAYKNRRAGDAVFFGGACDCKKDPAGIHHVGLMMNSGTLMWNALHTGTTVGQTNFGSWKGSDKPCPDVIRFNK